MQGLPLLVFWLLLQGQDVDNGHSVGGTEFLLFVSCAICDTVTIVGA